MAGVNAATTAALSYVAGGYAWDPSRRDLAMSEHPEKKDFIEAAKRQLAQISAEFEKTFENLKDPDGRKRMASSYLDLLEQGLSKAQHSVASYRERMAPNPTADAPPPPDAPAGPAAPPPPAPDPAPPESPAPPPAAP